MYNIYYNCNIYYTSISIYITQKYILILCMVKYYLLSQDNIYNWHLKIYTINKPILNYTL